MSNTLILYASVHGHTEKICRYMAKQLTAMGDNVTVSHLTDAPTLTGFDKVLIGASIRHGKHNPAVQAYIAAHQHELESKANGFFSVSLVARKPLKNTPETNPYMQAFLAQINWQPKQLAVFGGRLNYQGYGFMDRNIIRFIMWMTKGPTDPNVDLEFTDWQKVDDFIDRFQHQQNPAEQAA
ncbi:oxygen-independent protoporphyrinogen oxidase HemG [Shewanella sp. NFH-SH190041]|uniref:menaquinone-dependent protoporphyrinogen IX dehydrogenase n=1 Tax=Shewanella sp. NFH-SH190041 TaxID=2950245 RepID=UPI0021C259A2|nr:menaquinone-dependent protoporphyrinogen IX dehydrogenase [Shewanella sp. NFH-SH190041]BDM65510.1 oxygen-independent protoporphyrinogen oxidase HemG [Shewanella sp. NFH-SH190041]